MTHLCKLFAAGQMTRLAGTIIEGGFVSPSKWQMLESVREAALKGIRPEVITLLDSFGIPDKYIRSEVVRGNPYDNFLNKAR